MFLYAGDVSNDDDLLIVSHPDDANTKSEHENNLMTRYGVPDSRVLTEQD